MAETGLHIIIKSGGDYQGSYDHLVLRESIVHIEARNAITDKPVCHLANGTRINLSWEEYRRLLNVLSKKEGE